MQKIKEALGLSVMCWLASSVAYAAPTSSVTYDLTNPNTLSDLGVALFEATSQGDLVAYNAETFGGGLLWTNSTDIQIGDYTFSSALWPAEPMYFAGGSGGVSFSGVRSINATIDAEDLRGELTITRTDGQAFDVNSLTVTWGGSVGNDLNFDLVPYIETDVQPTISYGQVNGYTITMNGANMPKNITKLILDSANTFQLQNIQLTSAAPAAVPLPAAAWSFGAGLMGLLFVNKRKPVA